MNSTTNRFNFITKSKILRLDKCTNLFLYRLSEKKNAVSDKNSSGRMYGYENQTIKNLSKKFLAQDATNTVTIPQSSNLQVCFEETLRAMDERRIIFHPVLVKDDLLAFPEILTPHPNGGYTSWEVSTSINTKKELELIIAFHKFVYEEADLPITDYKVLRINPNFLLGEEFALHEFFEELNFNKKASNHSSRLEELVAELRKIRTNRDYQPAPKTCSGFKSCSIPNHCFPDLQEGNIFTLRESSGTAMDLYKQGVRFLKDIPTDTELTDRQKIQIETEKNDTPHIEKDKIQEFLNRIHYPVYYLDFETINPQIPVFPSTKPFQHIPFLFSLHIWKDPSEDQLVHHNYIQEDLQDPRKSILERLSDLIKPGGTILCFNDFFEKRCIEESVQMHREFRPWWESIRPYFLDSAIPFKNMYYYNPEQKGSASLKDILPALTSQSHSHLDIQSGFFANFEYLRLLKDPSTRDEKEEIFNQLIEYCKMDTLALYLIQKELVRIVA